MGADAYATLSRLVHQMSPVLLAVALLIELSGIALLINKRLCIIFLGGMVSLNLMIFLVQGVCFWKWTIAVTALAGLVAILRDEQWRGLFGRWPLAASAAIILLAPHHLRPIPLGWFESRLDYTFEIEVEDANGVVRSGHPSVLAPFEITFSFDRSPICWMRSSSRRERATS